MSQGLRGGRDWEGGWVRRMMRLVLSCGRKGLIVGGGRRDEPWGEGRGVSYVIYGVGYGGLWVMEM